MKKTLFITFLASTLCIRSLAQIMPYGVVDTADLKMTSCDFETDANAEVLFDQALVSYQYETITMLRHKRIKIFNDNGKDQANVRIQFYGAHGDERIVDVVAQTINLDNNTILYTPVDKKQIFTENTDKSRRAIIFTFPDVKAGSIIEFTYKWSTPYPYNYPDWLFQGEIPCRYSEFDAGFDHEYLMNYFRHTHQKMVKDTIIRAGTSNDSQHIWAMSNVSSYKTEPFMDYPEDYLQCILLKTYHATWSWTRIGTDMLNDEDFGKQLDEKLSNEKDILNTVSTLKTDDEKIALIFNTVKKTMNWNKDDYWFTVDGTKKAWEKKTGNSTEINLALYHLLRAANIKAALVAVCTRDKGKIDPLYPTARSLDRTVVYYGVDSGRYYILDATSPVNTYNNTPLELMGLKSLYIDPDKKQARLFDIKVGSAREVILADGELDATGQMNGTFQISSSAYSREKYLKQYRDLGEKKYIEDFEGKSKKLKIASLKIDNMDSDTLPLVQTLKFSYKSAEPDGDYMYLDPNIFTGFAENPFISETRVANIDFKCLYSYAITGRYKIPEGYKVDALPKSVNMQMPDKGIVFRRILAEQDGIVMVRYIIDYRKSLYSQSDYPMVRDFFKKMYEMLNEQIVFKKA